MTATKAIAGGVAANVVTVVLWAISNVPGWNAVPDEPKAAMIGLVSAAVGAVIVYFAPANKQTFTATVPENGREFGGSLRPRTAIAGVTD
jgi:Na+/melibiose symporter-like transporter